MSRRDQLKGFIERVERLEDDRKSINLDIREVLAEAKSNGFDVKTIRAIIKLRKIDEQERKEADAILETYMTAIGMT